jgi:hypothetical protein
VQRVRIESQQLRAASPVASHALLEPLVDAILMCSCTQGEKQLRLHHCASSNLTQERIANQTGDEDAVEKKDDDWVYDCTIGVISMRLD